MKRISLAMLFVLIVNQSLRAQIPMPAPESVNRAVRWQAMFQHDPSGFTRFPNGEGARIIRMSASEGSDLNDGLTKPVRTLVKAMSLARNGYPDRVLLKRGDVFDATTWNEDFQRGGRSEAEPMIVGAYGDPSQPRPVITPILSLGGRGGVPQFLVLQSLDLYADERDPSRPGYDPEKLDSKHAAGINMNFNGECLWIEDCRSRYFENGMVFQCPDNLHYHTLVVRRCVVADSYSYKSHSEGLYVQNIDNVLIEENLFDHNGWNEPSSKTIFNHDIYVQRGAYNDDRHYLVRGNIIARASSHGCQLRTGGVIENNLFLKNPLAGFVEDTPSIVRDNVALDSDDIGPGNPRGQGIELLHCPSALVEGNIFAHKPDRRNTESAIACSPALKDEAAVPTRVQIRHNVVYDWTGPVFQSSPGLAALSINDNFFQQTAGTLIQLEAWSPGFIFGGNHYSTSVAQPFQISLRGMDFATWQQKTGDASVNAAVQFTDPARDIASYAKSIELPAATLEGFLAAARGQRMGQWSPRLTASEANRYIRAGFMVTDMPSAWPSAGGTAATSGGR